MGDLTARDECPNMNLYPQLLLTFQLHYYEYQKAESIFSATTYDIGGWLNNKTGNKKHGVTILVRLLTLA